MLRPNRSLRRHNCSRRIVNDNAYEYSVSNDEYDGRERETTGIETTNMISTTELMTTELMTTKPPTTTTPNPCTSCAMGDVTIITDDPNEGAKLFEMNTVSTVNGCKVYTFVCTGTSANIQLNSVFTIGDPGSGTDDTVTAMLDCNANGQWVYTAMGVSTVITTAECDAVD
ncbi:hypothetical protein WR25_00573 [Diploscapter pachys]|uniref:C6 domain-containing protein n=1 Tax=Diploscapter pachys TaxID=2018661 RepID=A0A2A2JJS1_9BILA|nr:hypothetical protein WR25_00573 [Diploscapter pachys]